MVKNEYQVFSDIEQIKAFACNLQTKADCIDYLKWIQEQIDNIIARALIRRETLETSKIPALYFEAYNLSEIIIKFKTLKHSVAIELSKYQIPKSEYPDTQRQPQDNLEMRRRHGCIAAKKLASQGEKLNYRNICARMKISETTLRNHRKKDPDLWLIIKDAFLKVEI